MYLLNELTEITKFLMNTELKKGFDLTYSKALKAETNSKMK